MIMYNLANLDLGDSTASFSGPKSDFMAKPILPLVQHTQPCQYTANPDRS